MLNKVGFIWDTQLHFWKERFTQLKKYIAEYGSVDEIPKPRGYKGKLSNEAKERNQIIGWIKVKSSRGMHGGKFLGIRFELPV
jgi:hypothetical protein